MNREDSRRDFRILITGLPGTGKTTLASAMKARLELPLVREAASELAMLGLTVSENATGSDLAAIAHQYHLERALDGNAFVADRGAVDVLAYARALRQRHTATALDRRLGGSICGFAESWLAARPYDLVISCECPFAARRITGSALTRLQEEQRAALSRVEVRLIRLMGATDYGECLDVVAALARSDR